jgi:O-antigen/teichoic acid export membrane protein
LPTLLETQVDGKATGKGVRRRVVSVTHRGLTERSVTGVLWTGLSVGAKSTLQLIALIIFARLLAPSEFGLFAATMVVIGFSAIFSSLGVGPAIVQRPELEDRHLRVGFTLSVLFSLVVAGLIWVGAPALGALFRLPEFAAAVRGTTLVFVCQGLAIVAEALAQRALRFRWLAAVDAGAFAAGFVVIGPLLAWQGFGVWALIVALIAQYALRTVLLLAGQPHRKRPQLDPRTIGELAYFGGGFTLARTGNYFASQVDKLVVGRWLGAQALGLYALAYQFVAAPAIIVGRVLDRVLFPTMALVQFEPARLARAYRSGIAVCALLTLPLSIVVTLLAPEIAEVLLGTKWVDAVVPLQILALGTLFRTSYKLSDSVARATGAVYARAWRQAAFAIAIFVASFIGQHWGLRGVAIGVVAGLAFNFTLMAHLSLRLTGMRWSAFAAAHVPGLALSVALGAVTWVLAGWLRDLQVAPILLLVAVAVTAFAATLLLWRNLPGIFLGCDGQSLLRALTTIAPAPLQTRMHWIVER